MTQFNKINANTTLNSSSDSEKLVHALSDLFGANNSLDAIANHAKLITEVKPSGNPVNIIAYQNNKSELVAETIIHNLGGEMFTMMTGAINFTRTPYGVTFELPTEELFVQQSIKHISVTVLDYFYLVSFFDDNGNLISEHDDIFDTRIQDVFTHETGLPTHMVDA